ncbi:hypothetical protein ES705_28995 [subsurface metagenome]
MYKVWESGQAIHGSYIEGIYRQGVAAGWSPAKVMTTLKDRGLSYRKTNMLHDYRKAQAIEMSKTPAARGNAEHWFDKIFEPLRVEKGFTAAQTTDFLRKGGLGVLDTVEEMEDYLAWEDKKEAEFWELYAAEKEITGYGSSKK